MFCSALAESVPTVGSARIALTAKESRMPASACPKRQFARRRQKDFPNYFLSVGQRRGVCTAVACRVTPVAMESSAGRTPAVVTVANARDRHTGVSASRDGASANLSARIGYAAMRAGCQVGGGPPTGHPFRSKGTGEAARARSERADWTVRVVLEEPTSLTAGAGIGIGWGQETLRLRFAPLRATREGYSAIAFRSPLLLA